VSADGGFDMGEYRCYPGPVTMRIRRDDHTESSTQVEDPDDQRLDLRHPPSVEVSAPLLDLGPRAVDLTLDGALPAQEILSTVQGALAAGRAGAVAALVDDDSCRICGDPYPAAQLVDPTGAGDLPVCPACVFDGDLVDVPAPGLLSYHLDEILDTDLAAPAGWAAVVALLTCATRPGLHQRLQKLGRRAGSFYQPNQHWADPDRLWLWLPAVGDRPAALAGLGVGASLGSVAAAIDRAHPDLRERVRAELRYSWQEARDDEGDPPDRFVNEIWPAIIAYAVTFTTQTADRPTYRPPWHVVESFDALPDHLHQLGSDLDPDDVHATLTVGLEVLTDALGLPTDS
jgi:hypothetical protein